MSDEIQNVKIRFITDTTDLAGARSAIQGVAKEEQKLEQQLKEVDTQAKKTNKTLQDESIKSSKAVDGSKKSVDGLMDKVKGLSSQIPGAFAVEQVLGFTAATRGAVGGIGAMSSAFGVLKAAIISTGIGALVVALGSLIAYFTLTDDGATKLSGIFGGLGAILKEVTGFVAELGSTIFGAFESVANFEQALKDLGDLILTNILNRFKAFLVYGEAIGKLLDGEFKDAAKTAADAFIQMNTGIADGTQKLAEFGERIAAAAQEAYNFALAMDAIDDAQRELNVTSAQNEQIISKLIIQSKNRTLTEKERIALIDQASALERENLKAQLDLENQRLALLQTRNERESKAINQRLNASLKEAKTEEERIKLKKEALSIDDKLADEEAKQREKIIKLQTSSLELEEKLQNRRDLLVEQGQQKQLNIIKKGIIDRENAIKQSYVDRQIDDKELISKLAENQIAGLKEERSFLIAHGKDVVEINKSIEDILVKQRIDADKEKLKADDELYKSGLDNLKSSIIQEENATKQKYIDKEISEEELQARLFTVQVNGLNDIRDYQVKNGKDTAEVDKQIQDAIIRQRMEGYKKDQKNLQESESQRKAIIQASFDAGMQIANSFFQLLKDGYSADLDELSYNKEQELKRVGDNKQAQDTINKKFAKQEAELKRKQAEVDKVQTIFGITIATALNVVKALGNPPTPGVNVALAAIAGALGAAQIAFVAARPLPKFNKGTKNVPGVDTGGDSIMAMLRPGEGVMPVDRMNQYRPAFEAMFDGRISPRFMNSIVMDYERLGKVLPSSSGAGEVDGLRTELKSMNRKLDKIQTVKIDMNEKGFKKYLISDMSQTEIANNYLSK
jgi:hypothetical protein